MEPVYRGLALTAVRKARAEEINEAFSRLAIDFYRLDGDLSVVRSRIAALLAESKADVKEYELLLAACERELVGIDGASADAPGSLATLRSFAGCRLASSRTIQLDTELFVDYMANGIVTAVTAIRHPADVESDGESAIDRRMLSGTEKERSWRERIVLPGGGAHELDGERYVGPVVDLVVRLRAPAPVNYVRLTPVGRFPLAVSIDVLTGGAWRSLVTRVTTNDYLECDTAGVPGGAKGIVTDTIRVRLNQEYGVEGALIDDGADVREIVRSVLLDENPNIDIINRYLAAAPASSTATVYTVGLYSLRVGFRRLAESGTCETGVIAADATDVVVPVTGARTADITPIPIYPHEDVSAGIVERYRVADTVAHRQTLSIGDDASLHPDIRTDGHRTLWIVRTGPTGELYPTRIVAVESLKVEIGGRKIAGVMAAGEDALVPFSASQIPEYAIVDGKLVVNFPIGGVPMVAEVRYRLSGFRIRFVLRGDGYTTPALAGYWWADDSRGT